jgi:DNA-binding NarL/FixJ family response regulator
LAVVADEVPAIADTSVAPLKVLIADDHPLMLGGVRRVLEHHDDIEIVGEARSGPELLDTIERRRPGLVLMDLRMPGMSGGECIASIRSRWPEVKVVVLSACQDQPSIDEALGAGASAYIVKRVEPSDIASVLRQAARGTVFHGPSGSHPLSGHAASGGDEAPILTEREHSILAAIATGMTTSAISEELWVSEHTIKFHLTNIYRKLGVPNRAGAVRYAFENGLAGAGAAGEPPRHGAR